MQLSIVICTWNRAVLLGQTLEAMTRLRVPPETDWELLVVNNHCTDQTDEVTAAYVDRLPLRRLWEPTPGKTHACNRAVREVRGDYVLWTDDDVLVSPDWMAEYLRAFERWPDAAVFGGPISPWFVDNPPRWLAQVFPRVACAYAVLDLGGQTRPLDPEQLLPYGANMATRTRELRKHPFDPLTGPRGERHGVGDETLVLQAILRAGNTGWWVPGARVRHYVPPQRQTVRFLRDYFRGHGELFGRQLDHSRSPKWFGRPRWAWRQAIEAELRFRLKRCFFPAPNWVEELIRASKLWGVLRGSVLAPILTPTAAISSPENS